MVSTTCILSKTVFPVLVTVIMYLTVSSAPSSRSPLSMTSSITLATVKLAKASINVSVGSFASPTLVVSGAVAVAVATFESLSIVKSASAISYVAM